MQTVFTLNKLSMDFYSNYPATQYAEIEYKPSRPYVVMVVDIDGNKFALPLRTNIRHNYCYKFKNTGRDTQSSTGIDFTKAVINKIIDQGERLCGNRDCAYLQAKNSDYLKKNKYD